MKRVISRRAVVVVVVSVLGGVMGSASSAHPRALPLPECPADAVPAPDPSGSAPSRVAAALDGAAVAPRVAAALDGAAVAPPPQATGGQQSFLGFGLGDERRYVLGPAEDLYAGEAAIWSVRLREVLADPPHGIFELSHEWAREQYRSEPPLGTLMSVNSEGELRVNAHGFPMELRFHTARQLYGLGERVYTVRYTLEGDDFHKLFSMDGRDFEQRVRVRRTDALDTSVPAGMWAHAPMALECMFTTPATSGSSMGGAAMPPLSGSSPPALPRQPLRYVREVECREPLFANPGLLSLMLPSLWEAGTGELEFLMLTPAGYFGMPGGSGGMGGSSGTVGVGSRAFDSELAGRAQTNSAIDDLRYVDRVRVDVGSRTLDAWRFEGMRAFDTVYVDDDGVVLRVDLAPGLSYRAFDDGDRYSDPRPSMDHRKLWIRLLFPSEY